MMTEKKTIVPLEFSDDAWTLVVAKGNIFKAYDIVCVGDLTGKYLAQCTELAYEYVLREKEKLAQTIKP